MRSTGTLLALATSAFVPALLVAQASGQSPSAPSVNLHALDSTITAIMKDRRVPGLSIALVQHGNVELVRAYGLASVQSRIPVDTATQFEVGSITKQFVAVLTLLLQEDGRLSVDDTLAKWYPNLIRAREITLLDLLNHVSGYPDYYPLDFVDRAMQQPTTGERIVQTFATRPLDFDPGTDWSYSNTGYAILGRVLERVTGKPLGTLLQERIFRPLGLNHTAYELDHGDHRASGYVSWALGAPEPATLEGKGWLGASGGIWSTPADLAKWDLALMRSGLISSASRELLFRERLLRDGTPTGYACGVQVGMIDGRFVVRHGGASAGFVAWNEFVPADTAAVVVLANGDQDVWDAVPITLVSPPRPTPAPAQTGSLRPRQPPVPRGLPAAQMVERFFDELQTGHVDRTSLGAEYDAFLSSQRVDSASRSLSALGKPTGVRLLALRERGGMENAIVLLTFASRELVVVMYRSSDGKIQQYLLW